MSRHRLLVASASLVSLSLGSAALAGSLPPLDYTTIQAMNCSFGPGEPAYLATSFTATGLPASYLSDGNYTHPTLASVSVLAAQWVPGVDQLHVRYYTGGVPALTGVTLGSATASWTVTFSTTVQVNSLISELQGTWVSSFGNVMVGDTFSAGTHTFTWTLDAPETVDTASNYAFSLGFVQSSTPGVPLPGAAGLAAAGLVGLSRRRRR